jgi:poly [ADP-ribose] polymerase
MPKVAGEIEAQYASSDRSQCKKCNRAIGKGELRIGEWRQAAQYDGLTVSWHHAKCWADKNKQKIRSLDDVRGLRQMRPTVQIEVCNLLALQPPDDVIPNLDDAQFNQLLAKLNRREPLPHGAANAATWFCADALADLTLAQLRAVLKHNEQPVTGGEQQVLERVIDLLLFGRLPKCPVCKDGDLQFSHTDNAYICHGYSSAWAKCSLRLAGFHALDRAPFVPPDSVCAFLDSWSARRHYSTGPWLGRESELFDASVIVKQLTDARAASLDGATATAPPQLQLQQQQQQQPPPQLSSAKAAAALMSDDELAARWREFLCSRDADDAGVFSSAANVIVSSRQWAAPPKVAAKGVPANAVVVKCGDDDFYHAMLIKVNLEKNSNSYYLLQLLQAGRKYYVWQAWGRIGTTIGSTKLTEDSSLGDAVATFTDKFAEKSGNNWSARQQFEKKAGLMHLVDDSAEAAGGGDGADEDDGNDSDVPSRLEPALQALLRLLFNRRNVRLMLEAMQFDSRKMPLGKLTQATIDEAFNVLTLLESALSSPTPSAAALQMQSARFYTLVPHVTDAAKALPLLASFELVREKIRMIETLRELIALQALFATPGTPTVSPLDARYAKLRCKLVALDEGGDVHRNVERVVRETRAPLTLGCRVVRVFRVERDGEADEFAAALTDVPANSKLLWHGSRLVNFVGILSQGLRVAPKSAPKTGYMFGKGVYFADVWGKSAEYCHAAPAPGATTAPGLMLLNEVLLGDAHVLDRGQYVEPSELKLLNRHSVFARGKREPAGVPVAVDPREPSLVVATGPCVEQHSQCELEFGEFVVFDTAHIKMRYLVQLEFSDVTEKHYRRHQDDDDEYDDDEHEDD